MNQKQLETLKKNNDESREFTRSCISAALIVLLNKDKLEDITISHLCSVAGVSRVAFYRNYKSIDDVLIDKIMVFAKRIGSKIGTDIYDNWLMVFSEAEKDKDLFLILIKLGIEHKVYDVFMSLLPLSEDSRSIQMIWLSLFHSFIFHWLKEKKPKKKEDAAKLAYRFTKNIPLVSVKDD